MGFSYNVNVLNQKGSPALYTDTFANRPNAGYAGRLFIANDTSAIYEDTGTAWVLIANVSSGAGTLQQVTTNGNTSNVGISVTAGGVSSNSLTVTSLTPGSVAFVGTGGLVTQDNPNLFWDDTNNRLGINTNTPSNNLDVHGTGTTALIALNNTAGNQSLIAFAKNSTAKWRIGNSSTDFFEILNVALTTNALTISSANNSAVFISSVQADDFLIQPTGYSLLASLSRNLTGAGYGVLTLRNSANGTIQPSSLTVDRTYTLPDATGTIALTSNLSAYLPLSGGTLTGNLIGTTASFTSTTEASTYLSASVVLAGGLGVAKNIRTNQNIIAEGIAGTIATLNGGDLQVYTTGNANFSSISSPSNGNMVLKVNQGSSAISALTINSNGVGTFITDLNVSGVLNVGSNTIIDFVTNTCRFYGNASTNTFAIGANNTIYYQGDASQFYPTLDNTRALGTAGFRYTTVYATTALINTSDINEKEQIEELTQLEKNVAIKLKGLIKKFKFKSAVNLKGDKARIHIGVIAQEVKQAFIEEGLNADEYGMFCSDTWFELDGVKVENDTEGAIEKTRLGIRYEELITFIISQI
jgi:hypothetical protein